VESFAVSIAKPCPLSGKPDIEPTLPLSGVLHDARAVAQMILDPL